MHRHSLTKTLSVTPRLMQDRYACASDFRIDSPSAESTHFPSRSTMRHPSGRELLRDRGAPDSAPAAPLLVEAAAPLAVGQRPWLKMPSTSPRSARSPASIRRTSLRQTTCGNCRSDTTNAGSPEILRCARFLATG